MTDMNQIEDTLNLEQSDMKKLPSMLNVLTILTYVGCAFVALSSIWNLFSASKAQEALKKLDDIPDTGSEFANKMISDSADLVQKSYDNRFLLLAVAIIGVALCFFGAMQMRNLKKQGFILYTVGELLPPIVSLAILGFGSIIAGAGAIFGLIIALVFVILYATQRKYLVN